MTIEKWCVFHEPRGKHGDGQFLPLAKESFLIPPFSSQGKGRGYLQQLLEKFAWVDVLDVS